MLRISLSNVILVKYFGLILLLDGIAKITHKSNFNNRDVLFAFHPGKQSFLGINYCLLAARNCIYISAKNEDPFCFTSYLTFLKNKLGIDKKKIRDLVTLNSTFILFDDRNLWIL